MTSFAIGKFDALHRGHFALAQQAARFGPPRLLTFGGMARELGWSERRPLLAASDRARVLAEWSHALGAAIEEVELPFASVRDMSPAQFVAHVQTRCGAQALVVGEDFRFGRDRSGDSATLSELATASGIQVAVQSPVLYAGKIISSSGVRRALSSGDVALAAALLGRPQRLIGTVVRGDGRGRQLGFPTANLGDRANQEPAPGVYAAWAEVDGHRVPAALNVGHLPTLGSARPLTVEAHLIGWSDEMYGRPLALDLIARVREEQRFASIEALVKQIQIDVVAVKQLLAV